MGPEVEIFRSARAQNEKLILVVVLVLQSEGLFRHFFEKGILGMDDSYPVLGMNGMEWNGRSTVFTE